METALTKAVIALGSQKLLADAIGVPPQNIWAWSARGRVPAERCPDIERATNGAVTCEDLRPDLAEQWAYLRGTTPQHKDAA